MSLLRLSFPARAKIGGEGLKDSADTPPEVARERRLLRVWRVQLQAYLLPDPRDELAPQLHANSHRHGPQADPQWVVDVDRFDDVLRDPFPFCERISTW